MTSSKHYLPCVTFSEETNCGTLYVTLVWEQDKKTLNKVLANLGKSGTCPKAHLSVIAELVCEIVKHMTKSQINIAMAKACGHLCSGQGVNKGTCSDKLIRRVVAECDKKVNNEHS